MNNNHFNNYAFQSVSDKGKTQMKTNKPKTIKEVIRELQIFLESDLYSKFRPETEINGEIFYREDTFKDEEEFLEYLNNHFDILIKQIDYIENETRN